MHSMQLRESDQNKPEICIDTDEETGNDDDAEGLDEGPIISFLPSLWNVANHLGNQYTQGLNGMKEVADDVVVMTTKTIGPRFIFGSGGWNNDTENGRSCWECSCPLRPNGGNRQHPCE